MISRPIASGSPWFARVKSGGRCELRPYSRAGWLLTAAYALALIAVGLFAYLREDPTTAEWISWTAISLAMTFAFLLIAWRTSARIESAAPSAGPKSPHNPAVALIIALLTTGAIIGAAFLGIEL